MSNPASWSPPNSPSPVVLSQKALHGQTVAANINGSVRFGDADGKSVSVEEVVEMTQRVKVLEAKMDLLTEAIGLNHQKGADGACREDCWSCRVNDTIKCIETARRLM